MLGLAQVDQPQQDDATEGAAHHVHHGQRKNRGNTVTDPHAIFLPCRLSFSSSPNCSRSTFHGTRIARRPERREPAGVRKRSSPHKRCADSMVSWTRPLRQAAKAADCKSAIPGSNPGGASSNREWLARCEDQPAKLRRPGRRTALVLYRLARQSLRSKLRYPIASTRCPDWGSWTGVRNGRSGIPSQSRDRVGCQLLPDAPSSLLLPGHYQDRVAPICPRAAFTRVTNSSIDSFRSLCSPVLSYSSTLMFRLFWMIGRNC